MREPVPTPLPIRARAKEATRDKPPRGAADRTYGRKPGERGKVRAATTTM